MENVTALYNSCLEKTKKRIKDLNLNVAITTITQVVKIVMEIVEATKLKGVEQNSLVTKIVRQIVVDAPISDDKEKLLLDLIDEQIMGDVVDLVVSASKGRLKINETAQVAANCCLAFLKSKQK